MRRDSTATRLNDMLAAIDRIAEYTADMSAEMFATDSRTVDAVVRNLIVIGEAASRVPEAYRSAHDQVPWPIMRGMRNVVVHEYWGVDISVVWQTVSEDLPPLRSQLQTLLSNLDASSG